ncbi:MAG: Type secretion system protein, partial [Verrucomicrobiota bacterium]
MTQFTYTAMTEAGQRVSGSLEAESEAAAMRALEDKRLFPVTVTGSAGASDGKPARRKVRTRDLGTLYGQLADLLGSGVPLLRALDSLIRSTPAPALRALLKEIRASVSDGKTLTDALREYPETFPTLHIAMIQAGERAAFLEAVLRNLSGFLERFEELRSKVMGALVFFVPRFEPLLAAAKKPLPTEILFGASTLVRGYWWLLLIGGAG